MSTKIKKIFARIRAQFFLFGALCALGVKTIFSAASTYAKASADE